LDFPVCTRLLLRLHSMAMAQVDQGAINGVVKDSTGAVIQGALVTLTNTDTNFVLQGTTDSKGITASLPSRSVIIPSGGDGSEV